MSSRGRGRGHSDRGAGGSRGGRGNFDSRNAPSYGGQTGGGGGNRGNRGGSGNYRGRSDPQSSRGGRAHHSAPSRIFRQNGSSPDLRVTQLEDDAFSNPESAMRTLSIEPELNSPLRPGFGTKGDKVVLFANYFELAFEKPIEIHRYSISVVPTDKDKPQPKGKKLARLVQLALPKFHEPVKNLVTDFHANILSAEKFEGDKEFKIHHAVEGSVPDTKAPPYKVVTKYNNSFDVKDLLDFLSSVATDDQNPMIKQNVIQALNIILSYGLKDSPEVMAEKNKFYQCVGENVDAVELGAGVRALRGYFLSVRPATGRILLNAQIKHLAVYKPLRLDVLLIELSYRPGAGADVLKAIHRFLKGLTVKIVHFTPHRVKKVSGFALTTDGAGLTHPPQVRRNGAHSHDARFWREEKGYITVAQYFQTTYNRISTSPLINLGTAANPSYFLAEVCMVSQDEPYRSRLTPEHSQKMINFAVRPPPDNATSIKDKGMAMIKAYSGSSLKLFDIELNTSFVVVDGRVLPPPALQYMSRQDLSTVNPTNGSWQHRSMLYAQSAQLPCWHVVWVTWKDKARRDAEPRFNDIGSVQKCADSMRRKLVADGVQAQSASKIHILEISNELDCEQEVRQGFDRISQHNPRPSLLLLSLPMKSTSIYNAIKRAGDIKYGFHTICVTTPKFAKSELAYLGNVTLKFNLKLGGRNQQLADEYLSFLSLGTTMLVGLDVTHPAPSENKAPSVAAIVASIDKSLGQWPADIRIQTRREEMVDELKDMVKSRLKLWYTHNDTYPDEILVYRDGVSESQYELVRDKELPQIRAACSELYPATKSKAGLPRISIVVVGKRHHTRFYPTASKDADSRTGNIKNGTVVDRGITEARVWDFYLTAHSALQGTAKPAHYVVIHDEIFRYRANQLRVGDDTRTKGEQAADIAQSLTHNLCYMFGRATKAVSVCPPAYYADIACERGRAWLSRVFADYEGSDTESVQGAQADEIRVHPALKDSMFYI